MSFFNPSIEKRYEKFCKKYIDSIPELYNQAEMINYLCDDTIDHYFSISTRRDGKTFNYTKFLILLAIEFDIKFGLYASRFTQRGNCVETIEKIYEKSEKMKQFPLHKKDLNFRGTQNYIQIIHAGKPIGIISDINAAQRLKEISNFLEDYPIIAYDEFLKLEEDYETDESLKLKTIYESIDRKGTIPLIHYPKHIYLGNAINFSSPVLADLDVFNKLETHEINTLKKYNNILLEMRRNDNANEERNTRAWGSIGDPMVTGEFKINKHNIPSEEKRIKIFITSRQFNIKLEKDEYLKVVYNYLTKEIMLSIVKNVDDYLFCQNINDIKKETHYLKENFYNENYVKKFEKGLYYFDNAFSKSKITNNYRLTTLKIQKCISMYETLINKKITQNEQNEIDYEKQYIERSKIHIFEKFYE